MTNATETPLTAAQVAADLAELFAASPDSVNPLRGVGFIGCAYIRRPDDNTRNAAPNCGIGTYARSMGWDFDASDEGNSAIDLAVKHDWPVTADAYEFMAKVQGRLDNLSHPDGYDNPLPWGEVDPIAILAS